MSRPRLSATAFLALLALPPLLAFAPLCASAQVPGPEPASAASAASPGAIPQQASDIERADVERVLRTLASDDMRGREAFTPDALRAADFLVGEFRAAGLESPEGADGYLQRFSVRTISSGPGRVVVDGKVLYPDRFAARLGAGSISWKTGDVPVVVVGPDESALVIGVTVANSGSDALILIDETQGEDFRQLVNVFRRPIRTLADTLGSTVVVALANATDESTFQVDIQANVQEESAANVVGTIPGRRSDEYVLFSAHYDHIGIQPLFQGDSIANGANDDASGTTAVVELAKHFASRGTPERTLLFAAFTAEEEGGYGSRYYSRQLDPDKVVAMLNIEMIGKPGREGPNTAWITGFDYSSLGAILQKAVEGTQYRFYPDPYPMQGLFFRSDNVTLATEGVPAHSISTTPIDVDRDYHRVTDDVETLDLDHLTNTIRAIAAGAEPIVSGAATPTRIDPSTLN